MRRKRTRRPARRTYPTDAERELVIRRRDDLMKELIEIFVATPPNEERAAINRLTRTHGAAEVRLVLDGFQKRSRRPMVGEEPGLYRAYRLAYARFGGERRFLNKPEFEELSFEHARLFAECEFKALLRRGPGQRERELRHLVLADEHARSVERGARSVERGAKGALRSSLFALRSWPPGGRGMSKVILDYRELDVYKRAFAGAMRIFEISKSFPPEERYSLTDQIRRSSRGVCTNIAEAWRKRRYPAHFVSKLSDADAEAAETLVWLDLALHCRCIDQDVHAELFDRYDHICAQLTTMMNNPEKWCRTGRRA